LTEKKIIHLFGKEREEREILEKIYERRMKKEVDFNRIQTAEEKIKDFHNF
jgi:hypothetical protein